MIEPVMMDLRRFGLLVYLDPASSTVPADLRGRLGTALADVAGTDLGSSLPIEMVELGDPRVLEKDRLTFILHALAQPAGRVVPGATGTVLTLTLRRFRHAPELPPGALIEAPPLALPLNQPAGSEAGPLATAIHQLFAITQGREPSTILR